MVLSLAPRFHFSKPNGRESPFASETSARGSVIAPTLEEYIRTVVHVREAYGANEDQPADWWHPYASHGTRFDLEQ